MLGGYVSVLCEVVQSLWPFQAETTQASLQGEILIISVCTSNNH